MSKPVNTKVMALRNPPMLFSDTFRVGGGGSPDHAADADPVGSVGRELDGVHPGRDVRVGVAGAGDLVEQLSGHGVDADQSAGTGMLGDHRGAIGVDLGQREAGVVRSGIFGKNEKLPPVAWVPHSMTWPATTAPASWS